ncbi:hypothetical protein L7F22_029846 [Adiantum nelumboides]|nr:hypothetical protein [Adiantum nelumboides]
MRKRRFENGALKMDSTKLAFQLDEGGLPTDATAYEQTEAHRLIEEFMLLANMTVAQQIAAGLPDTALLRRHDKPIDRRLDGFQQRAKKMGFELDTSSSGACLRPLRDRGEKARSTLESLATKAMLRAKYFCTGMVDISSTTIFALNIPLYTHFTSPIRRYADVMVHRQLDTVLADSDKFPIDREAWQRLRSSATSRGMPPSSHRSRAPISSSACSSTTLLSATDQWYDRRRSCLYWTPPLTSSFTNLASRSGCTSTRFPWNTTRTKSTMAC